MDLEDRYHVLSEAYKNPTKFSIILLLTENKKMTVTEMSRHIDVSRSNLYHFVAQLVQDKILNEPEVRPKKNYVEKFYSLNFRIFESIVPEKWDEHLQKLPRDDIRGILRSFLIAQSLNLKLLAEKVKRASDDDIDRFKDALLTDEALTSYSVISAKSVGIIKEHIQDILKSLDAEGGKVEQSGTDEMSRLFILLFPFF